MTTDTTHRLRQARRRLSPYVKILVIVVVGAIAAWKIDLGAVRDAFTITSWGFLIVAILANFASVGFKGRRVEGRGGRAAGRAARTRYRDILARCSSASCSTPCSPPAWARS